MDLSTLTELRTPQPLAVDRSRWHSILSAAADASGEPRPRSTQARMAGSVAVVALSGFIGYRSQLARYYGTELSDFSTELARLDKSAHVSAVLIDVDSPGGTVSGVPEAAEAIHRMKTPTIAVADPFAASAAVWLAAACDVFLSLGSGDVGSIGVWSMHVDATGWNTQHGIRVNIIASSSEKVETSSDLPLSADARRAMQQSVDKIYARFKADITRFRGMGPTNAHARMMDADDAAKAGLIDGTIDQMQTALQLASDLGRLREGQRAAYRRELDIARAEGRGPATRRWFHALGAVDKSGRYQTVAKEQAAARKAEIDRLARTR